MPGLAVLRRYQRAWLRSDLVAGLVISALLIPQGMAYAELAGLPAVTGLYTTVVGLIAYAVFGPSRILVLGPDSSLAPVIAAIVLPLTVADDPWEAVAFASLLAIFTGLICIAAGLLRLGAITDLLSMPVRVGYINGIAVVVLVSQLPKLFGFSVTADGTIDAFVQFLEGLGDGTAIPAAIIVGGVSIAVILAGRRWFPRLPGILVAVLGSIAAVALFDLAIPVVGPLPSGIPTPTLPGVGFDDLGPLLVGAIAISLIAIADTSAVSRVFAAKLGDDVDPNQEIVALGVANVSAGFVQGFPTSASTSRTSVALSVESKSQLTGLIGAGVILVLLLGANNLISDLPSTTLAAIVVVASLALFDFGTLRWLARVRRTDLALSVAAMLGVVFVGVLEGLGIAVALSIAVFVWRTWRPYSVPLGRVTGRKGYHDVTRHPDASRFSGLLLFRFDAPLFFANASYFERRVHAAIAEHPGEVAWVVIAAEPVTDVDSTAAEMLDRLLDTCEHHDLCLVFAELKGPVKDRLHRYGLYDRIGDDAFFPTLGSAVTAYVAEHGEGGV